MSEGGYAVYKRLSTGMIAAPPATRISTPQGVGGWAGVWPFALYICPAHRSASVCECLPTTTSSSSIGSVGPLQRLGRATVTDAPDCQLASFDKTTTSPYKGKGVD